MEFGVWSLEFGVWKKLQKIVRDRIRVIREKNSCLNYSCLRFRRPIFRYLFYAAWIVVIGGIVSLLASANSKAKARTCKGVMVSINNGGEKIYVENGDVLKSIEKAAGGKIVKKHNGDINLGLLEKSLEKNPWIQDAELYFDTKDILHVAISERVPVARVFTTAGTSFYIDSAGYQLPLLESYSAKLPVVTGFTAVKRLNAADSTLLQETKEVVRTISGDPFWNAQVGQIDITEERKFELIPLLGSHVIKLGSGNNVSDKLAKLMVFYKQVLPRAGFAKYSALDVQFDGQVIAVRRGPTSAVDSIQLQKNIEELMEKKVAEQEPDDVAQAIPIQATISNGDFDVEPGSGNASTANPVPVSTTNAVRAGPVKTNATIQKPSPRKTNPKSNTVQKPAVRKKSSPKPKAVMQKRG